MLLPKSALKACFCFTKENIPAFQLKQQHSPVVTQEIVEKANESICSREFKKNQEGRSPGNPTANLPRTRLNSAECEITEVT